MGRVFVDECCMIRAKLLSQVDSRMKLPSIPFGNKDMVFCGDLRQLPAVRQIPIYKRTTLNFTADSVWQTLVYYPLEQVMRQANIICSRLSFGNVDECEYLPGKPFRRSSVCRSNPSAAIRLFHTNREMDGYHACFFNGLI